MDSTMMKERWSSPESAELVKGRSRDLATWPVEDLCVTTIRTLAMDAVQNADSGHPGTPMALAPLAFVLWDRIMRYDPHDPEWFDRDRFGIATTLGWGPRYLHSIGQLHKGGANTGVFLVLTCDESEDLAIPDSPFGFSTLHHAQALGDIRALRDVRRRVVRVHLKGEPATALEHLVGALNARVGGATEEVR